MDLSATQLRIAHRPASDRHCMVLAGPGSGKTRTIAARVARLLEAERVSAEQILITTFTTKAAAELKSRLERRLGTAVNGIWADTFHGLAARLLRTYASGNSLPRHWTICDEPRMDRLLRVAAERCGWVESTPYALRDLRSAVSRCKRQRLNEPQTFSIDPELAFPLEVLACYQRLLRDAGALDFDDLLLEATNLIAIDADVADALHRRFRWLFVDEFHDVTPEQYAFIRSIAPPFRGVQSLMVVADPGQAIYSWTGADAVAMLSQFKRDYRPMTFELPDNFRSTGTLVQAAAALRDPDAGLRTLQAVKDAGHHRISIARCPAPEQEARWIAQQVARAHTVGGHAYNDIAVLFRTHRHGDIIEQALLAQAIPLRRFQRERLWDQPEVQNALRYLELIASLHDEHFEPALNWPRVLVDEMTMLHLRRLGREHGLTLPELAAAINAFTDHVSPLTRCAINQFLATVAADLLPIATAPIDVIVDRLVAALDRRRSPLPASERLNLRGAFDVIGAPLEEPARHLGRALTDRRSVVIVTDSTVDAVCGATIIEYVLQSYLQASVRIAHGHDSAAPGEFTIVLGEGSAPGADGFAIALRPAGAISYSISTQAWRLCQLLLLAYETLDRGHFVVYDLETTGVQEGTAEIVEVAAQQFHGRRPVGEPFYSLVKPHGHIPFEATQVHGIRTSDVRAAPPVEEVLGPFLTYLGDTIVVGHNILQFDHRIVARHARSLELPLPEPDLLDTCTIARRLLPDESHTMEALATRFGLDAAHLHRAARDVEVGGEVFYHLLDLSRQQYELDVLSEALPVVAIGIVASGVTIVDENATLRRAGARAVHWGQGRELMQRLEIIEPSVRVIAERDGWHTTHHADSDADDVAWQDMTERWRKVVGHFMSFSDDHSLSAFLHHARLATSVDDQFDETARVTLSTIHASKGLEWPLVFVAGVEDDVFPAYSSKTPQQQAEDRRVLYVALTRAQERLVLSWSTNKNGYPKTYSRYLDSIPQHLLRTHSVRSP